MSRDRRLDELAKVEFTGSLGEAFADYATVLRELARQWDTELGLASGDVKAALTSMRTKWLGLDAATRRIKARRVARRLRRSQTLVAAIAKCAERFVKEYEKQFTTPESARERSRG